MCAIKEELGNQALYEGNVVYGSLQRQIEVNNYVAEQLGRDEKYCKFCGTTKEEDCKCNDSSNQYE